MSRTSDAFEPLHLTVVPILSGKQCTESDRLGINPARGSARPVIKASFSAPVQTEHLGA